MDADSFFYQLFNQLPQTFFELLGMPASRAQAYRFDSVELKKSFRIDGLFLPNSQRLPLYFTEVQFQRRPAFYANLFAKVFSYLNENNPKQEWFAAAIFATRRAEPTHVKPYEDLLRSKRVKRVYLEEIAKTKNPPVGLALLKLLFVTDQEAETLAPRVVQKAKTDLTDSELPAKVVELVERLLMNRFPGLEREEMRMKFKLHDIRESKVWKEAHDEGDTGRLKKTIDTLVRKGKTFEDIADLLEIPLKKIRDLANNHSLSAK